jgi:ubiquinone/menaquinone biosynthesis C-methylase UbiE
MIIQDKNKIKEFWEQRATDFGKSMHATLGETYLRKLEIRTMLRILKRLNPSSILEIGSGNGYSTFIYAKKFPSVKIFATDYSEKMLNIAKENYARENIAYKKWDITQPNEFPFEKKKFDFIFSQRVIQNLPSWEMQKETINFLISLLGDKGILCLMECSEEGVNELNQWRERFFRKPIDGIIPWHNKFLEDTKLEKEFDKNLIKIFYFSSSYMFISRIISHRFGKIAWLLPPIGKFGYDRAYFFRR